MADLEGHKKENDGAHDNEMVCVLRVIRYVGKARRGMVFCGGGVGGYVTEELLQVALSHACS